MPSSPTYERITTPEVINHQSLHLKWGNKLGFDDPDRLRQFLEFAAKDYGDVEYHNFEHALGVAWRAMELADLTENKLAKGDFLNRKALFCAAIYHDAGHAQEDKIQNWSSPEAYSSELFTVASFVFGLDDRDRYIGRKAIFATKPGVKPLSREDRALVRADIHNVGGDYDEDFLKANTALMVESKNRKEKNGEIFEKAHFDSYSLDALANFLVQDLRLGHKDVEYEIWLKNARKNFERYAKSIARENHVPLPTLVRQIGSSALKTMLGDTLAI